MRLLQIGFGAVTLGFLLLVVCRLGGIREALLHSSFPSASEIARSIEAEAVPFGFDPAGSSGANGQVESVSFVVLSRSVSACPNVYPQLGMIATIRDAGNSNGLARYELTLKSTFGSWPSPLVFSLAYERPGGGRAVKAYQVIHHPDWKPEDAFSVLDK